MDLEVGLKDALGAKNPLRAMKGAVFRMRQFGFNRAHSGNERDFFLVRASVLNDPALAIPVPVGCCAKARAALRSRSVEAENGAAAPILRDIGTGIFEEKISAALRKRRKLIQRYPVARFQPEAVRRNHRRIREQAADRIIEIISCRVP